MKEQKYKQSHSLFNVLSTVNDLSVALKFQKYNFHTDVIIVKL